MNPLLSHRQTESLTKCDGRVNLWEGAVRSGKTYVSILAFLMNVATAGTGGEIVITGKNRDSIYRNFFRVIEEAAGIRTIRDHVKYRQGAPTATIFGRTVHVIGANDAKAESVIRGMTVLLAYADELTVLPKEFFKQLLARMSPPGAQLFATTNPDNSNHWLKTEYLDKLDTLPNWRRFKFTMDDNPSLTDTYRESLKAEYSGVWYNRFILGEWGNAEGAIFDMFDPSPYPTGHTIPDALVRQGKFQVVGIDHGSTNPTSAVMLTTAHIDGETRLILANEWRYDGAKNTSRLTNEEQAFQVNAWKAAHAKTAFVYVDPAAADFREQLRRNGVTNYAADNDVTRGLQLMASLLKTKRLLIAESCTGLLKELPAYRWDPKATSKGKDTPIKEDDHSIDAARYAIQSSRHKWRRYVKESTNAA